MTAHLPGNKPDRSDKSPWVVNTKHTALFPVRYPHPLLDALKALAAEEGAYTSEVIVRLLTERMKAEGRL